MKKEKDIVCSKQHGILDSDTSIQLKTSNQHTFHLHMHFLSGSFCYVAVWIIWWCDTSSLFAHCIYISKKEEVYFLAIELLHECNIGHQTSKSSLTIELLKLGNFRHKAGLKVGFAYVFFSK